MTYIYKRCRFLNNKMASQGKNLFKRKLHFNVRKCLPLQFPRANYTYRHDFISAVTLCFLAIWHGFHSGYYLTFFYEMLVMNFEKQVKNNIFNILRQLFSVPFKLILNSYGCLLLQFFWMVDNSPIVKELYKSFAFKVVTKIIGKFYVLFFIPHCFMPFGLLKSRIYLPGIKAFAVCN